MVRGPVWRAVPLRGSQRLAPPEAPETCGVLGFSEVPLELLPLSERPWVTRLPPLSPPSPGRPVSGLGYAEGKATPGPRGPGRLG